MNVTDNFEQNVKSVEKLINFDRHVLEMAIDSIGKLHERLIQPPNNITNEKLNGKRTLDQLQNIRTNDSLKLYYSTINNQAVVLLVSYFGSAIADLFRKAALASVNSREEESVLNTEIKLKVKDLLDFHSSDEQSIGNILINKSDISFQDMKSIQREFKSFFSINIPKEDHVNEIILSQACRHSIVHEGSIVNERIINQVRSANPRKLKTSLVVNQDIEFTEEEIVIVSNSMRKYVENLESKVLNYCDSV